MVGCGVQGLRIMGAECELALGPRASVSLAFLGEPSLERRQS